jgi:hypothetical protein
MGIHSLAATACGQRNKVQEPTRSPLRYEIQRNISIKFRNHSLAENGKDEITNEPGAFLMMKTDSQQLAPHMQSREAGTSDFFVFF